MGKKKDLKKIITKTPYPKDFTIQDLDTLMNECGCDKFSGGRGSSLKYVHKKTKRVLTFDGPHPGKELYRYQIKKVIAFLSEIGEL